MKERLIIVTLLLLLILKTTTILLDGTFRFSTNLITKKVTAGDVTKKDDEKHTGAEELNSRSHGTPGTDADTDSNNDVHMNTNSATVHASKNSSNISSLSTKRKHYIFGHSTGHAGSTSLHEAIATKGCPWDDAVVAKFEQKVYPEFYDKYNGSETLCNVTKTITIPAINQYIEKQESKRNKYHNNEDVQEITYIDLGHFHNIGRVMECLAESLLERSTFIHIRRNRYFIARSFAADFVTPCKFDIGQYIGKIPKKHIHPVVSVCPRSGEWAGPVNLPVDDDTWDEMTPFQRFLWLADELEHRWHTLTGKYGYTVGSNVGHVHVQGHHSNFTTTPAFYEVTWSNKKDFELEVNKLRGLLGCDPTIDAAKNKKSHTEHRTGTLNCTEYIQQDFQYRRKMKYDDETLKMLVSSQFPQHVDNEECMENREELDNAIQIYARLENMKYDEDSWVLPPE